MVEAELAVAVRIAIEGHPEGVEAGPKAIQTLLQASDERFADVGLQKFKKIFAKVKTSITEEGENAKLKAAKPQAGDAENCPQRCGPMKRSLAKPGGFCCDVCRCHIKEGAPTWCCRPCNWDVCEGKCHPAWKSLEDLKDTLSGLEKRIEELSIEAPAEMQTKLALVETDVHKFERLLDNASVDELCKASVFTMDEGEARNGKKALIKGSEKLLQKIEGIFAGQRSSGGYPGPAAEPAKI